MEFICVLVQMAPQPRMYGPQRYGMRWSPYRFNANQVSLLYALLSLSIAADFRHPSLYSLCFAQFIFFVKQSIFFNFVIRTTPISGGKAGHRGQRSDFQSCLHKINVIIYLRWTPTQMNLGPCHWGPYQLMLLNMTVSYFLYKVILSNLQYFTR